jgi:uncharacterized protein YjbJ (UPF0337 family)
MHELKGSAVESVGNMTGSTDWKQSGQQERIQGQGETKAAQAQGYAQGTGERMGGKKDELLGSITGDKSQQAQGLWCFRFSCYYHFEPFHRHCSP